MRLLSATHKDLGAEVQAGQFRQDLYYRLNVIQIRVPPLRERLEDLLARSASACSSASRATPASGRAPRLTRDALVHLARYPFPGNVRELENLLHRAVALSGGESIDVYDLGLPETVFTDSAAQELEQPSPSTRSIGAVPRPQRAHVAPLPGRGAAAERPGRATSTRSSATSSCARSSSIASTAPPPDRASGLSLRQMRYRMARLGVNVGGDAGSADRE